MMCSETKPGGKELNYLEWLSAHTPTKWWHDSAIPDEIERGLAMGALGITTRSEERRVGKECRSRWSPYH